jgi:hypothetical protein
MDAGFIRQDERRALVLQHTSNAYAFNDPSSKFKFQTGTAAQAADKKEFASNVPRRAACATPKVVWGRLFSTAET